MTYNGKTVIRMIGKYSGRVCAVIVQYADKSIERIRLDFDKSERRIVTKMETAEYIGQFPSLYKAWRMAS